MRWVLGDAMRPFPPAPRMMPLFRRTKQTIGLDVGSGLIKGAVIEHGAAAPRLIRLAALPLVSDAIVEGEIMDPGIVVDTIQAVIQTLGVRSKNVVTSVGGRDVIVKKIEMDRMPATDAREVIRWEAEQYVPFDMENVQLDFQILDPEADGLQMSVLLVAAKRDLIEQRLMLLRDAGLTPSVVDVDAFALFNAFEYNYPGASRGVGVLVDVGHEIATVLAYQDSVPVVTRDVPFGSRQLREELRRMHGLSSEEAESLIRGGSPRTREFEQLLYDKGSELAMAIERATAFLSMDAGGGAGPGAVYLSGGGARIPRLHEAITDRLRTRLEVVNPFQRLEVAPEATVEIAGDDSAAMWMLPIGLALRADV